MRLTTQLLDQAVAGVRPHDGVDTRELEGSRLYEALSAACDLLSMARLLAAPLAAAADRLSGPAELRGGFARASGHRTAEHLVASLLGGTLADARRLIEAGLAMDPDPVPNPDPDPGPDPDDDDDENDDADPDGDEGGDEGGDDGDDPESSNGSGTPDPGPPPGSLEEALLHGTVLVDASSLIRRTLTALASAGVDGGVLWEIELRLVEKAKRVDLSALRKACLWEQASADPEGWRKREQSLRRERWLTIREESDGMFALRGRLDPLSAAHLVTWLDAETKSAFQRARTDGVPEHRTAGQIRVDSLATLAAHALGCNAQGSGAKTTVVVTIDHATLRSELGFAQVDGVGAPLSAAALRHLAVDAQLLPVVLGGSSEVLDLGRTLRPFSTAQRRALLIRDGGCAWCGAPAGWAEAHHLVPWGRGGSTDLSNGVLLCRSCHLRIHDTGWTVEIEDQTVWFVPPASVDPERRRVLGGRRCVEPRDLPPEPEAPPGAPPDVSRAPRKASPRPPAPARDRPEAQASHSDTAGLFELAAPQGP